MSLLKRETKKVFFNGNEVWRMVQIYSRKNEAMDYDTSYVEIKTLKPIAYRAMIYAKQREFYDFINNKMLGYLFWPDSLDKKFDEDLNEDEFNSVVDLDILECLDFKKEKTYKLKYYNPGKVHYESNYTLEKIEKIKLGGEKDIECLKIVCENIWSNGRKNSTIYYLEKETHKLLKQVYTFPNNSGEFTKTILF
jgi:hypothetical protein